MRAPALVLEKDVFAITRAMPAKERKLKQAYILCLMFVGLIGSIAATYAYMNVSHPDGVTCARDRLASFGWTDRRMPLAEMAAIATWQR
jgi:hypothetical protein